MKTIIAIALTLFSITAFAQNYDCLQFGAKNYFINGNGDVRGIRIDSIRPSGSDVIYYPYRTQRISNYNLGGIGSDDTLGGSWLGKKVIKQADGTFLFDNLWDTVIIKTQAHLGDSWIFFNDATNFYYTATVTAEDTMTALGMLDSVKTITITADSAGIMNTADPLNGFQLILSKNNGFVQDFDLYTFPYRKPILANFLPLYSNFDYYLDVLLDNLEYGDGGWSNNPPT